MTSMSVRHVGTTSTRNDMIEVYKMDEFLALELEEVPSLLGDSLIVPQGRVIIYGAPGTYKSFATMHLCYALSGADEWLGYDIKENIPTLYLQAEIVPRMMQERAGKVRDNFGTNDNLHYAYIRDFTLAGEASWQEVVDVVNDTGAEFIFFDPMSNILSGSELDDGAVRNFLKNLDRLTVATGAGVGLVHHARKENFNRDGSTNFAGADDLRGHSSINGWADTIIRLRRPRNVAGVIELTWEKVRHAQEPTDKWLRFDNESGILKLSEADPIVLLTQLLQDGPKHRDIVDQMLIKQAGLGERRALQTRLKLEADEIIEMYKDPVDKRRMMVRLKEK